MKRINEYKKIFKVEGAIVKYLVFFSILKMNVLIQII